MVYVEFLNEYGKVIPPKDISPLRVTNSFPIYCSFFFTIRKRKIISLYY
jgi:hypothetical protein